MIPFPRAELPTPALVIDRAALDRNIARMAEFTAANGLALRPHAKTHKSADIARLQISAGAVGVCCAKLGEAEALAEQGIGDILLTSPVVTPWGIRRLITLAGRVEALAVAVDHPANVAALAEAADEAGRALTVLIDIDPGMQRTGVASPKNARMAMDVTPSTPAKMSACRSFMAPVGNGRPRVRAICSSMRRSRT